MACTGAYATAKQFADIFCTTIPDEQIPLVNFHLSRTAGRIHMARAAADMCSCNLGEGAAEYLMELNAVLVACMYKCPCSNVKLTSEERVAFLEATGDDLQAIREGKIELCSGQTGADYPYTGWAEQGVNEFARTQIIVNDILRHL